MMLETNDFRNNSLLEEDYMWDKILQDTEIENIPVKTVQLNSIIKSQAKKAQKQKSEYENLVNSIFRQISEVAIIKVQY